MGTIVVGVDGSEGSVEALRFALGEAALRGAAVRAVNAWHVLPMAYETGWAGVAADLGEYPKLAQAALEHALDTAGTPGSGVEVTPVVREGQAAEILCEEARGADLLVVGSRGHGGFLDLLLGSVSQQCAHHAPCPVTIVPKAQAHQVPAS
jgi:nucleotide-binding universal stress UspA family protein